MALSIRPGETTFGATPLKEQNEGKLNLAPPVQNKQNAPAPLALNFQALQAPGDPTAINDAVEAHLGTDRQTPAEQRASTVLFQASLSVTVKKDATERVDETTERLTVKVQELKKETNPTRKEEIRTEIQEIITKAQEDFERAKEDNPRLEERETFTVVIKPSANIDDPDRTVTVTVAEAASPESAGLTQLSFADEDLEATEEQLQTIHETLRMKTAQFDSTATVISDAVRSHVSAVTAEEQVRQHSETATADERAESIAERIRSQLHLEIQPIENVAVESLLHSPDPFMEEHEQPHASSRLLGGLSGGSDNEKGNEQPKEQQLIQQIT